MKVATVDRLTDVAGATVLFGAVIVGLVLGLVLGMKTAPVIKSYSGGVDYANTRKNNPITGEQRPARELSTDCGQYVDSGLAASYGYDRPDDFRQGCEYVVQGMSK